MSVAIQRVNPAEAARLVGGVAYTKDQINRHLLATTHIEAGFIDGKFVAVWGVIPPTMVSDQAYIWVYTTMDLVGHEFVFIRNSQRMVEKFLKEFSTIVGVTEIDNKRAVRWLKWLGAEYGEPQDGYMPFVIRRK